MVFNTHKLNGLLEKYVESIFHVKDFIPDHSIERVVPTGHIYLIFELDGFERNTFDNETLKPIATYTKVWLSGMHKNHISISAHDNSEMFVIQFKSFGACTFLNMQIEELNEKVIPAEKILGDEIFNFRDKILNKETSDEKFHLAEEWLLGKFNSENIPPTDILNILEKLQIEPISNYEKIIGEYPKTTKHLISQFKKYIGLTPKNYQRILRFNEVLQIINKSKKVEWSQIAYQCEFTDQSHFIKEFKHFCGINPKEYIQNEFHKDEMNFSHLIENRKG